jgi:hypothetical protein
MTTILLATLFLAPEAAPKPDRERIESIELDASGQAGVIRTSPEFMRGTNAEYRFGEGPCKAHKLGDRTLEQLMDAMRAKHLVKITADDRGSEDTAVKCVRRVTFFAPEG